MKKRVWVSASEFVREGESPGAPAERLAKEWGGKTVRFTADRKVGRVVGWQHEGGLLACFDEGEGSVVRPSSGFTVTLPFKGNWAWDTLDAVEVEAVTELVACPGDPPQQLYSLRVWLPDGKVLLERSGRGRVVEVEEVASCPDELARYILKIRA